MFHTDSEKFSHALSVLNVLLTDWCPVRLLCRSTAGNLSACGDGELVHWRSLSV